MAKRTLAEKELKEDTIEATDTTQTTDQGTQETDKTTDDDDEEQEKETVQEKVAETATVAAPKSSSVKIRCSEDIDATIGGVSYVFSKKTTQSVPSGVAAILCNSGKAFRV